MTKITVKTPDEIKLLKEGGKILGHILGQLADMCVPGITTWEIDQAAEKLIAEAGGRPSFKGYASDPDSDPFPSSICASINQELVHGFPRKETVLKDGDIFTIDIGMEWPLAILNAGVKTTRENGRGFYTDTAITVPIGTIPRKTKELLRVTRLSLETGLKAVKPGRPVSDIGAAIANYVNSQGQYGIVRDLVGHGVGYAVHEEPRIPNYYDRELDRIIMKPGMVLAIEPMISLGGYRVATGKDGWTIEMADQSLCAHYEHTVVVTNNGHQVITRRPGEKK